MQLPESLLQLAFFLALRFSVTGSERHQDVLPYVSPMW
jgi:hypothetical protein